MTKPSPDYRAGWNEALSAVLKRIGHWRELTYAELGVALDSLRLAPPPPAEETEVCPECESFIRQHGCSAPACGKCGGTGRVPLKTTPAGSTGSAGVRLGTPEPSESGWRSIVTHEEMKPIVNRLCAHGGAHNPDVAERLTIAAYVEQRRNLAVPTTKPLPDGPGWWVRFHTTGEDPRPQVVPWEHYSNVRAWEHYANVSLSDLRDSDLRFYGPLPIQESGT